VDPGDAAWTISLYALMLAVATPVYGRASDLVGVRIPLLVGVCLMSVGAMVAATAPTFGVHLGARILQGAGAAAIPTLGVAAVSHRYQGAVRGLALGRLAGVTAALSSIGPFVGGAVAAATVPAAWFSLLIAVPAVLVGHGWAAWQVGVLLVPPAVLSLLTPRLAGPMLARLGPARTLAAAAVLALAALGVAAGGALLVSPALLALAVGLVVVGYGIGQPAMTDAVNGAVAVELRGVALGMATLVFMVGASVGSAALGGIGDAWGVAAALGVVALLPVLGLLALRPLLERSSPVSDFDEVSGG